MVENSVIRRGGIDVAHRNYVVADTPQFGNQGHRKILVSK